MLRIPIGPIGFKEYSIIKPFPLGIWSVLDGILGAPQKVVGPCNIRRPPKPREWNLLVVGGAGRAGFQEHHHL